jgi:hypothetical protein
MSLVTGGRWEGCRVGDEKFICHTRNRSILLTSTLERWLGQILSSFTTHCLLPARIQHQLNSTTCSTINLSPALIFRYTTTKELKRGQNEGVGDTTSTAPSLYAQRIWQGSLQGRGVAMNRPPPGLGASPPSVNTWMEDKHVVRLWATITCHLKFMYPSSNPISIYATSL